MRLVCAITPRLRYIEHGYRTCGICTIAISMLYIPQVRPQFLFGCSNFSAPKYPLSQVFSPPTCWLDGLIQWISSIDLSDLILVSPKWR